jgi:hypothetical protein
VNCFQWILFGAMGEFLAVGFRIYYRGHIFISQWGFIFKPWANCFQWIFVWCHGRIFGSWVSYLLPWAILFAVGFRFVCTVGECVTVGIRFFHSGHFNGLRSTSPRRSIPRHPTSPLLDMTGS